MSVLAPGSTVTVRLLKAPRPDVTYPATVLGDDGVRVVVRADWAGPPVSDFGAFRFETGDVFTEYYWRDRWYSIKEVRSASGTLKGWYCDVARPAQVTAAEVSTADLDLDLWLSGDGSLVLRLDEDEFAESGLADTDPDAAAEAIRTLDELETLARRGFPGLLTLPGSPLH
ncbi:DUF402 domain-containing protein [Longispora albida]|uniref:DUF402 domain-containing protein n=1 Tax=Longispora albida TaxID=203523 RepID=UPI000370D3DD|nr:DUF402 domain-containing protein [Longispora albida]